jgi:hypothetical protein
MSGYASLEGWTFAYKSLLSQQKSLNASLAFQLEYYTEFDNGSVFTVVPFARIDAIDAKRTHFDIRELNYLWFNDSWEFRIGIGKVFWGVTEFVHLVDIINQTDAVESIDGEEKLGQAMAHLTFLPNWGILELFVLPYFRERTFPGIHGRLRFPFVVATDNPRYESAAKEYHTDFAIRYSHSLSDWDIGIYHFYGTGREPTLLLSNNSNGIPTMIPYYQIINQTGIEFQLVAGEWLFKLESIYRTGQGDNFFATVNGIEYSIAALAGTRFDVGLIGQWAYDSRGKNAASPYQGDIMFGLRLGFNDAADSQFLAGIIQDLNNPARIISIEASRRFGLSWRASIEAWLFLSTPVYDQLYSLRNDDYFRAELAYYF